MGFLGRLFGGRQPSVPSRPYVDAGFDLTRELIALFQLEDWKDGHPLYTPAEMGAIESETEAFEKAVGFEAGEHFAPELQRECVSSGLNKLADKGEATPEQCVSTYLKAWASGLNPYSMSQLGHVVAGMGRYDEARKAFQVVLLFATYQDRYFAERVFWLKDGASELTNKLMDEARECIEKLSGPERNLFYRGDYGTLPILPSNEAKAILSAMTKEEKANFTDLLGRLQTWQESIAKARPHQLRFHPEARVSLWGAALAKMADHYRGIGRNDRALFFTEAAWNLSRHPLFAYNAALLRTEAGDLMRARSLLQTYLAEYRNVLKSPVLMLATPEITTGELEDIARSARARLAAMQSK